MPFTADGQTTDPSVSVPTASAPRLADTAAAEPELEPQGFRSSTNGFRHCPPLALQPDDERFDRMLAHSLMFAFARSTAPAARSRSATCESRGGTEPSSASEPAVVVIRSAVSMLSLRSTGTPCSGPRVRPFARSRSSCSAMLSASGLVSMIEWSEGPARSVAAMRARYCSTMRREVQRPEAIPSRSWARVASSSSNGGGDASAGRSAAGESSRRPANPVRPAAAPRPSTAAWPRNSRRSSGSRGSGMVPKIARCRAGRAERDESPRAQRRGHARRHAPFTSLRAAPPIGSRPSAHALTATGRPAASSDAAGASIRIP